MTKPMLFGWAFALVLLAGPLFSVSRAAEPNSVTVNVLTYSDHGGPSGQCNPVYITASNSRNSSLQVGFFESEVSGTGDQWRAAGWMAAVTAAMLTDFDPRVRRVTFEFEGRIDGPSAGALLTCGVLAAARGDEIRPDAAMTGTINPDGSIGPVNGIPHKIDGAAEQGMKLVLIPPGIRFEEDRATGERVDLVERGAQQGVKVVNVFNVYHAYELLTGSELPRAPAAHAPQVSLAAQKQLRGKIEAWGTRYKHSLKAFMDLKNSAAVSDEVVALYQEGVDAIERSNDLVDEGEFAAGMWDRVYGAACGYLALETGRCRYTYATTGYAGLVKRLRSNQWLADEVTKISQRLQTETPQTLDQLSIYLIACDAFIEGVALQRVAGFALDNLPDTDSEEALEMAGGAAENQILAWLDLKLAGDYLDLASGYEGIPIPVVAPWRQVGDYLRRASAANMAVFDSVIVEPIAAELSVGGDRLRGHLMKRDKNYAILRGAEEFVFPNLQAYFGDGDSLGYAYLAMGMYTHVRAAGLLAKYDSLDAEMNESGYVTEVAQKRTLAEWLTYAEDQSRRNIALLQENGVDASPCAQLYGIARIKARRDQMQQMESLIEFWSADMHARVLRMLSGVAQNEREPEPAPPAPGDPIESDPAAPLEPSNPAE